MVSKARYSSPDQDIARSSVRANLTDLKSIQTMEKRELLNIQEALGFGSIWGVIVIPPRFMPAGSFQKRSKRIHDFREAAAGDERGIRAVTQFVLLRWLVPIGQTTRPCTASTLGETLGILRRLLVVALTKPAASNGGIWSRLSTLDLEAVSPTTPKRNFGRIFETLNSKGLLTDTISIPVRRRLDRLEKTRYGACLDEQPAGGQDPYLALPDAFVAECGWKCVWLIKVLGPLLLSALELALKDNTLDQRIERHSAFKRFRLKSKKLISGFRWVDPKGITVTPPFQIHLNSADRKGHHRPVKPLRWPPKSAPDLWRLAWIVQAAHAFVVGLSGGPREGELLSLTKDALVESSEGWRVRGKTFKLVFREDGEVRDWPAPGLCVLAVEQQTRIAQLAESAAEACGYDTRGPHLWVILPIVSYESSGLPLHGLGSSFKGLTKALGLNHLLDQSALRERTLHPHRLRKTTGRLVGLALTNGLHVLTDLFGHDDPEMTVAYLLSNKDIAEEAQAVAQAQTIMFASEAILDSDCASGNAAFRVRRDAAEFARLRGLEKLDAQNVDELARDLTENGQYWELVQPGVLCTKLPGQIGVCNGKQGAPDSTHCRSSCDYRLERSAVKANVDRTIARALEHLECALRDDEPLAAAMWRGQVSANLDRFPDLRAKWGEHPLVCGDARFNLVDLNRE